MSSPMKDALTEFINNNTSAVEQAMENGSHDLTKREPGTPDLVNYLSCSTPQAYSKDIEPMSTNEKIEAPNLRFNSGDQQLAQQTHFNTCLPQDSHDLQLAQQTHFNTRLPQDSHDLQLAQQAHFSPCPPQDSHAAGQFGSSQLCAPSMENSFSNDMPLNHLPTFSHQDIQQHHCLNGSDSFDQVTSLYPDPSLHIINSTSCGFQDLQLANPSAFGSSNSSEHTDTQITPSTTGSETHYSQERQAAQYQVSPDPNKNYHSDHQTHVLAMENCANQFEKQPESSGSNFKEPSVLLSTFNTSACAEVSYGCGQDGLGFGIMNVNEASLGSLETAPNHFRAPEKMHVDEPEAIFQQQTGISTNIDHYQTTPAQPEGSNDVHMKSFSPKDCHAHSPLDTEQASANIGLSDSFHQTLTNVSASHSVNEFTTSSQASLNTVESPASFDIPIDPHQPSVPSTFSNQTFQQTPAALQACAELDFQGQPSLCPSKDAVTNPSHYLSQQLDSSSSAEPSQHSSQLNKPSHYQGTHYQDSPINCCSASPNIPDGFTSTSTSPQGLTQTHHLCHGSNIDSVSFKESRASFQPPLLESGQHHHSDALDLNYSSEADKQATGFQSNAGSLHDSVLFSTSCPASNQLQSKDYLINHDHIPSAQENDSSKFIDYSSSEDPLLSANVCPEVNPVSASQTLADFEMSTSSVQGHSLVDPSKPSADITMRDFLSGGSLLSSCHAGFTDDSDSFPQLDLEAVVNSFNAETSSSTIPQSESIMSAVSFQPSYNGFEYNLNSDSVTFPVVDTNTHFSFSNPCQADQDVGSCPPAVASCDHNTGSHFGASSFGLPPTPEGTSVNYHQPMQVQEAEPPSAHPYHSPASNEGIVNNTEIAMDVSSSLGEKGGGISSSISYEEIHMSIVKAGNALSKEASEAKTLDPHEVYFNPAAQVTCVDPLGTDSGIYSMTSSRMFEADKSDKNITGTYDPATQTATSSASELMPLPSKFTHDLTSCTTDATASESLHSTCHIFSSILNNLQEPAESSSQPPHQDQASQTPLTVPNFLENPETNVQHVHASNPDHLILTANQSASRPQSSFVVTVTTPSIPDSLVGGSSLTQLQVGGLQNSSITTSHLPGLSSHNSSSSFFGHPAAPCGTDHLSAADGSHPIKLSAQAPSLNITGAPLGQDSGSSSGAFLHLAPSQSDKTSTLPSTSDNTNKFGTNPLMAQKSGSTMIFGGLTTGPAVNPPPALSSSSNRQPHIIVSLEDLQKLLAQQNLSQPSPSTPQQQPYTTMSSPQTLVLQKHASHSLKLSQPRLLIKGATLPSQPRISHPHQQLQQTREKLQFLMHQSHPSEHPATSQRQLEPTSSSISQDNRQKIANHFQFASVSNLEQQPQQKLPLLQQTVEQQPRVQLQLKQSQIFQQQQTVNLFLQQAPKAGEPKLAPLQLLGHQQQLVLPQSQHQPQTDQKQFPHIESQLHLPQNVGQKGSGTTQKSQDVIQLAQMKQELFLLLKQQEKTQEFEDLQLQQFHMQHQQHLQPLEKSEATDRPCSESMKKDYKHLHSLLTREVPGGSSNLLQAKIHPPNLNLATSLPGQATLQLTCGGTPGTSSSITTTQTFSTTTPMSSARLSFLPLNSSSLLQLTSSGSTHSSSPLTTLAFVKTLTAPTVSKDFTVEVNSSQPGSPFMQFFIKSENVSSDKNELDTLTDHLSSRQASILTHTSTERKRSHTPLSIDLNSPTNSISEPASPLSSPTACEDGNTQLTLIERSADLQIKSDSMHGADDADDNDNASFDVNAFHKRPSADEFHSTRKKNESVPMKIAKPSINADARSGINPSTSLEPTFDFGSAVTSASNFSFTFGNKDDNKSDVFTFGLNGTAATTTTTDTLLHKDGLKHYRLSSSKPVMKAASMRSTVPTQPVRPTSKKQKEHSLKAYYPSKLENMELKILQQPEPQHRARYQTEGSRGAIKDASQQGFPVIKLFGYNKPAKLQVFIGDECGRVKPHGFYQACRVFGKNSTSCLEQEIEDTTVIEVEMLPEGDMTVKLDCVGILKLRNADVERRIGPKRAREKKKTNTRARLVMRCLVEKSDGNQQVLQVVSNPIVCTQPVGQPEVCRMSLSESSVAGGGSLFIIGKNFKNKGTSVLFQQLDPGEENVVWQVEAEVEQEFFQPTHLICKVPPYKDQRVSKSQLCQIVVNCAGKTSDPHSFTYKPVYSASSPVKQEMPMDTDNSLSTRSMSFVSPEALHLNRMVQLTNSHSVPTTSLMFQLPQGTIPPSQVTTDSEQLLSQLTKPVRTSLNHPSNQAPALVMTPHTAVSSSSSSMIPATSNGCTLGTSSSSEALQSFLLEDKSNGLVPESSSTASMADAFLSPSSDRPQVNCIVHSHLDTSTTSPTSYAVSHNHHQPLLTSSAGQAVHLDKTTCVTKSSPSLPSKPYYVFVDPKALHSQGGSDKIQQLSFSSPVQQLSFSSPVQQLSFSSPVQQLLQHILETQGQGW